MASRDTFIAFNSEDRSAAEEIRKWMDERGIEAWMDDPDGEGGRLVMEQLTQAIGDSETVTVLCGKAGLGNFQTKEVGMAEHLKKRIIPVILPGADADQIRNRFGFLSDIRFSDTLTENGPRISLEKSITGSPPSAVRRREIAELFDILETTDISDAIATEVFFNQKEPRPTMLPPFAERQNFRALVELRAGQVHNNLQCPLLSFIAACRPYIRPLDGIQKKWLDDWIRRVAERFCMDVEQILKTTVETAPENVDMLVKIAPNRFETNQFQVDAWTLTDKKAAWCFFPNSALGPVSEAQAGSINGEQLPGIIKRLAEVLDESRPDLNAGQIHVFLPWTLIEEPVNTWSAETIGTTQVQAGEKHCLCVRSYDRVYDRAVYRKSSKEWRKKWQQWCTTIKPNYIHTISQAEDYDHRLPVTLLQDGLSVVFARASRQTQQESLIHLKGIIEAGIPVILWPRTAVNQALTADRVLHDLSEKLQDWPKNLRNLRCGPSHPRGSFWHETTLILDDPNKLPPDAYFQHQLPFSHS